MSLILIIFGGIFIALLVGFLIAYELYDFGHGRIGIISGIAAGLLIIGVILWWLYGTQSGAMFRKTSVSNIGGLERTVRVYTADGTLLAEYEGKFTIGDDNGGVTFELDGKRYIYWNCFIESIEH